MHDETPPSAPHRRRRVLILSFRQSPLSLWGCYGSSLCQTPHLDRFASHGWTFDNHFLDDLRTERPDAAPLPLVPAGQGIASELISDQPDAEPLLRYDFEHRTLIAPPSEDGSPFKQLLQAAREAIDEFERSGRNWLLWIYSSEFADLPIPEREFLELYLDELIPHPDEPLDHDEPIPDLTAQQRAEALQRVDDTIERLLGEDHRPDAADAEVLRILAAATLSGFDREIGALVQELDRRFDGEQILVALTAERGFSLQEDLIAARLNTDRVNTPIVEEIVHLPLVIRNDPAGEARRIPTLTRPDDLRRIVTNWFSNTDPPAAPLPADDSTVDRSDLILRADHWTALRTPEWLYLHSAADDEQLFVLPDDRWQTLNVINQEIATAENLRTRLAQVERQE